MKHLLVFALGVVASSAAYAELIVPQGTKARLQVTYQFKSVGKFVSPAKDVRSDWNALRVVEISADYVAGPPQAFGGLHQDDSKQKQDLDALQGSIQNLHTTLAPTMQDMMKIAERCDEDEECITREISNYGKQMDKSTVQAGKQEGATVSKLATAPRFQSWQLTSQTGTYRIDEVVNTQVFEMTCTETKVCKRTETRKGGGSIMPGGTGKPPTGSSMLEVDSFNKDMMAMLPLPLAQLAYTETVTTTMIDDEGGTRQQVSPPWMMKLQQAPPVRIGGDLKTVSGSQSIEVAGEKADGGTLTVNWTFTRL